MKYIIQAAIVVAIIASGLALKEYLVKTKPEAKKIPIVKELPVIEVITAQKTSIPVEIKTQGEIRPPKRTTITAQVTGKITSISPQYEVGETFQTGEIILTLEDFDYQTAVINAKAAKAQALSALRDAELNLKQEEARASQALRDWEKLGRGKTASDLLLRKPQLSAAKAKLEAAKLSVQQSEAGIKQAQKNLDRTKIRAPYPCRIESKQVDLGALVTTGMPVTTLYQIGTTEVRLPISLEDLPFIEIKNKQKIPIKARAQFGGTMKEWNGHIIRNENTISPTSRTAFIVAEFKGQDIPPIGLFINVTFSGKKLEEVFAIPRTALRNQNKVITVSPEDKLNFKTVTIARTTEDLVYISSGLENNNRICTTVMNSPIAGAKIKIAE